VNFILFFLDCFYIVICFVLNFFCYAYHNIIFVWFGLPYGHSHDHAFFVFVPFPLRSLFLSFLFCLTNNESLVSFLYCLLLLLSYIISYTFFCLLLFSFVCLAQILLPLQCFVPSPHSPPLPLVRSSSLAQCHLPERSTLWCVSLSLSLSLSSYLQALIYYYFSLALFWIGTCCAGKQSAPSWLPILLSEYSASFALIRRGKMMVGNFFSPFPVFSPIILTFLGKSRAQLKTRGGS
jgi:hypothetical protein